MGNSASGGGDGVAEVAIPTGVSVSVIDASSKSPSLSLQSSQPQAAAEAPSTPAVVQVKSSGPAVTPGPSPQILSQKPPETVSSIDVGGVSLYRAGIDSFDRGRYSEAITLLQSAADQGHTKAMCHLGVCCLYGIGLDRNVTEAIKLFSKVAETSDGAGETQLGLMYLKGRGVEKDHTRAVSYFQAAADKGDVNAKSHLAFIKLQGRGGLELNVNEAIGTLRALEPLAVEAAYYLGLCSILGLGMPRESAEAMRYLTKAVESGHMESHVLLGYLYLNGPSKNVWEAAKLFFHAAERGNPIAQFYVGALYRDGLGLAKNDAQAKRFFKMSADQGNTLAIYALAKFQLEREPETDWLDAAEMFVKAATQSNREEMPERFYIDGVARAFHVAI